jgi:hypothetical protein
MPKPPFQPLALIANPLAECLFTVHQSCAVLVQHGQLHCDMKSIQNMFGFRAHIELEITNNLAAVEQKCDLLVELAALRFKGLVQTSFRFAVNGLHKAKACARRGLCVLIAEEDIGVTAQALHDRIAELEAENRALWETTS